MYKYNRGWCSKIVDLKCSKELVQPGMPRIKYIIIALWTKKPLNFITKK